jgi:hypothetical protein
MGSSIPPVRGGALETKEIMEKKDASSNVGSNIA